MAVSVHIVQRMAPGGIETLVLDLASRDPEIRILSLEGDAEALIAAWPELGALADRFTALGKMPGAKPALVRTVATALTRLGAASVVVHHLGPLVYGGLAARIARVPVCVHVEHDGWHYRSRSHARLGRLMQRLVRPRRVAVSQSTAETAGLTLAAEPVAIVPNGVDLGRFVPGDREAARAALGLPSGVTLIGSLGRLAKVKGHDVLIEAVGYLPGDWHVAIAGDGDMLEGLKRQAATLDLSDRIHFLGHQDRPERVYPAFDIFCLPSRAEGFPRALIEAQACDIPVVASDVGGVREAVCPNTGRLVIPEHPMRLALALVAAVERPSGESPRSFVDPVFSLERTAAAYRSLADGPPLRQAS